MGHSDDLRRAGRVLRGVLSGLLLGVVATFVNLLIRAQGRIEGLGRRILKRLFLRLHERGHGDAFIVARAVTVAAQAAAIAPLALLREAAAGLGLSLMGRDRQTCEIVDGARASLDCFPVRRYCREAVAILRGVPDGEERE